MTKFCSKTFIKSHRYCVCIEDEPKTPCGKFLYMLITIWLSLISIFNPRRYLYPNNLTLHPSVREHKCKFPNLLPTPPPFAPRGDISGIIEKEIEHPPESPAVSIPPDRDLSYTLFSPSQYTVHMYIVYTFYKLPFSLSRSPSFIYTDAGLLVSPYVLHCNK